MIALRMFLTLVVSATGQQRADEVRDAMLADAYVDGTYGFSIRPPAGWHLVRQRVPERRGTTLLRMLSRTAESRRPEEILLRRTSTTRAIPMGEMLKAIHHSLELEFSNVELLSKQEQQIAERPGGVLAASYWREGRRWLRLEALIELRPQRYFVLSYRGQATARRESEALFHRVLASLRLLEDGLSEFELREAFEAGSAFLSEIDSAALRGAIIPKQLLRVEIDGEPIGFVRIEQKAKTVEGKRGVGMRERGWLFESNGRIRRLQANMFVSDDLQEERWKTSVTTLVPGEAGTPARLEIALEEGLRREDILLTSQVYDMNDPTTQNPPVQVPRTYIPKVLLRLLPRLAGDLSHPRRLAFTQFDHQHAGMVVRVVELKGARRPPRGATQAKAYWIEEREGLVGTPSNLYVDETGQVLMVEAGNLTMLPAKLAALERLFESRSAAADREMMRLEKLYEQQRRRFAPKRGARKKPSS